MPLKKGAKPGTKGFGDNIKEELKTKPRSQAIAIAFSEAKQSKKKNKKHK